MKYAALLSAAALISGCGLSGAPVAVPANSLSQQRADEIEAKCKAPEGSLVVSDGTLTVDFRLSDQSAVCLYEELVATGEIKFPSNVGNQQHNVPKAN